jgi:hypothetical protein
MLQSRDKFIRKAKRKRHRNQESRLSQEADTLKKVNEDKILRLRQDLLKHYHQNK